ncbi:MAG TPA: thioredoxin [Gemmatimonadales bacterium]
MADSKYTVAVTDDTFVGTVEKGQGLVLVDFWAEWCGPCRMIAPSLEQLGQEYAGKVTIAKMDVDSNPKSPMRFNVRSIPTLMFFKDGKHVDTVIGAVPKTTLDQKIRQHLDEKVKQHL